jgi:hypothetical protein
MQTPLRVFLLIVSTIQFLFAIAFYLQLPAVTSLWVFPGTTPLTFIFLASIFAAAAAATAWAAWSRNYGALAGIGLDYLMILAPVGIYAWQLGSRQGNAGLTGYAVVCAGGALFGLGLFLWSRRIPLDTSIPTPPLVRWSFVGFIVALAIVSTLLIRQTPNVIPWVITPELSVVIGWMFFGALTYFAYGLLRPRWANAAGQLFGFLAYDIVLLIPFFTRLPTVAPEFQMGLWIYTGVVTYSAVLAVYYLFVNPQTRVWQSNPAPAIT